MQPSGRLSWQSHCVAEWRHRAYTVMDAVAAPRSKFNDRSCDSVAYLAGTGCGGDEVTPPQSLDGFDEVVEYRQADLLAHRAGGRLP